MVMEIVPFAEALLPAAETLFGDGYPSAAVRAAWERPNAAGMAALRSGELVAYLLGDPVINEHWGRSAWTRLAGCGVAPGQDPDLLRDLYAALGERWVRAGCFSHFVLARADDAALLRLWFSLSFGIEQVHGLLSLETLPTSRREAPPGLTIRRADEEDRSRMEALSSIIWRHQVRAPVWGIHLPEDDHSRRQSWGDLTTDPEATLWLAFLEGELAGAQVYFPHPVTPADPTVPEGCIELSVAATVEAARGRGVGTALTHHALEQARAAGYRYCATDWRSTNLLSSRFWPALGFQPVAYRLVRRVDPRIAWAGERRGEF